MWPSSTFLFLCALRFYQVVRQKVTVLVGDRVVIVMAVSVGEPGLCHVLPQMVLFHDNSAPGY